MSRTVKPAIISALAALLLAALVGAVPATTSPAGGEDPATLAVSPVEGPTGTTIDISGEACVLEDGTGADGVVVTLQSDAGETLAGGTLPVERDGTFSGTLEVPAGVPAGVHRLRGTCVSPELPDLALYDGGTFTVTGEGADAQPEEELLAEAAPLAGGIEPYPSYDGQTVCSPAAKPGTLTFSQRTLATFTNTGTYGISRECNIGGRSEHKEGRAWDWKADARNAAQHASVDKMLNWLLATDSQGNRHAMARRLGVMYIIWDRQMFRMYRPNDGWQPYSGSHPHTDHVHISFTRAGGNKTTSYWSMRNPPAWGGIGSTPPPPPPPPPPSGPAPVSFTQTQLNISGHFTPIAADFNGDGRDDVLWYGPGSGQDVIWWGQGGGRFSGRAITVRGTYQPLAGDYDGDGSDDILWYGPGSARDYIWYGRSGTFVSQSIAVGGVYDPPVVGDFNGDGRSDVLWYGPGKNFDYLWWGTPYGRFVGQATTVRGTYQPPFAGDFDGDGKDDIYWYGRNGMADYLWHGRADGRFDGSARNMPISRRPLVGNYNGDGRDDVFWYAGGAPTDFVWLGGNNRGFVGQNLRNVQGRYDGAFVADLDDNGRDDVYWYAPGGRNDYIWSF